MSRNTQIITAIVLLVLVAGGIYYWHTKSASRMGSAAGDVFTSASTTLPSGSDTSDQGLDQDTAAIDAQMKGLDADKASVNTSVDESAQTQ